MVSFDPLRLPNQSRPKLSPSRPPKHRRDEGFLMGPIPWAWLQQAARLPGRELHVAIFLWRFALMNNTDTLTVTVNVLEELGVKRHAASRALKNLDRAGLIKAIQHPGRKPRVTLLPYPSEALYARTSDDC